LTMTKHMHPALKGNQGPLAVGPYL
jgi:hypothetical protein